MNDFNEVMERIKKNVHDKMRRRDIICPYCDEAQSKDTAYGHVSYWGEDEEFEVDCENCNKKFFAKEKVEREFICRIRNIDEVLK